MISTIESLGFHLPPVESTIGGATRDHEVQILAWLATETAGDVLDFGTWYGSTAARIARFTDGHVWSFDLIPDQSGAMHPQQRHESLPDNHVGAALRYVPNATLTLLNHDAVQIPESVGPITDPRLAFIDSDHTYEGVKRSTKMAELAAIKSNTAMVLVWHDYYQHPHPWIGVKRYVDELSDGGREVRLISNTSMAVSVFTPPGAVPMSRRVLSALQLTA
jgi:SAM-dependent methyltransferase